MNRWELEELIATMIDAKNVDKIINDGLVEDLLLEKYGLDFDTLCEFLEDLIVFTPKLKSEISGELFHTLGVTEHGYFRSIVWLIERYNES